MLMSFLNPVAHDPMNMPIYMVCRDFPTPFGAALHHIRSLGLAEWPDYQQLRKFFREEYDNRGFENNGVFDWSVYKYEGLHTVSPREYDRSCPDLFLQFQRSPPPQSEISRFVEGIGKNLEKAGQECRMLQDGLDRNVLALSRQDFMEKHKALWCWILDFFTAQHFAASPELHVLPDESKKLDRLVDYGTQSAISSIQFRDPPLALEYCRVAYDGVLALFMAVPHLRFQMSDKLRILAHYRAGMETWDGAAHHWEEVGARWRSKDRYRERRAVVPPFSAKL